MVRDLRDPTVLGAAILHLCELATAERRGGVIRKPASWLYDVNKPYAPDYDGTNDIRPRVESGAAH